MFHLRSYTLTSMLDGVCLNTYTQVKTCYSCIPPSSPRHVCRRSYRRASTTHYNQSVRHQNRTYPERTFIHPTQKQIDMAKSWSCRDMRVRRMQHHRKPKEEFDWATIQCNHVHLRTADVVLESKQRGKGKSRLSS